MPKPKEITQLEKNLEKFIKQVESQKKNLQGFNKTQLQEYEKQFTKDSKAHIDSAKLFTQNYSKTPFKLSVLRFFGFGSLARKAQSQRSNNLVTLTSLKHQVTMESKNISQAINKAKAAIEKVDAAIKDSSSTGVLEYMKKVAAVSKGLTLSDEQKKVYEQRLNERAEHSLRIPTTNLRDLKDLRPPAKPEKIQQYEKLLNNEIEQAQKLLSKLSTGKKELTDLIKEAKQTIEEWGPVSAMPDAITSTKAPDAPQGRPSGGTRLAVSEPSETTPSVSPGKNMPSWLNKPSSKPSTTSKNEKHVDNPATPTLGNP